MPTDIARFDIRRWVLQYALALFVALSGCTTQPVVQATQFKTADQQLDALLDAYFEEYLILNPIVATYIGDARYNARLGNNIAPAYTKAMVALHRKYFDAIERLGAKNLSPRAQLSAAIFKHECEDIFAAGKFPTYLLPLDQMNSMPATLAELGAGENAQPFEDVRDYENFLKRAVEFTPWVDQAIANMRVGMKLNVVQPRVVMLKVLPQLQAMIVEDATSSIFYRPIRHFPDTIGPVDRERLARSYHVAIATIIVPAYRRLHAFVRDEYLPQTRDTVAWAALPNGDMWYRHLVRVATTTSMQPAEIHQIGLQEVARIRSEMEQVKVRLNFPGDLQAFFRHLEADPALFFKNADELLAAHRQLKARIDATLPQLFKDFPKADYEIRPVEEFRAQAAAGAFYQPPSADGSRSGIFFVNTFNLKAQPKFGMTTLSLHEASPGHHFQISIQQEIADMPRFRRFIVGYVAYTEGWALYCESLGREMNLFDDPYQYFGHLNDEQLRAMRLVVDTGLHTKNWSRDQAIAYMLNNSSMAPSDAEAEVERYIANPGQALGYKIGQLRIRALRTQASEALGVRFDIKEFHGQVLRDGPLPLDILTVKIANWIKGQQ